MSNRETTFSTPELIDLANKINSELCQGRGWRMCIPARPDQDDDLVFGEVCRRLEKAEKRVAELDSLRELLESAERVVEVARRLRANGTNHGREIALCLASDAMALTAALENFDARREKLGAKVP